MKYAIIIGLIVLALFNNDIPDTDDPPAGVYIYEVVPTPTVEESVTLMNNSDVDVDISGWTLEDENHPTAYEIPVGTIIKAHETITFPFSKLGFRINDWNEVIYLMNSEGEIIDTWENCKDYD